MPDVGAWIELHPASPANRGGVLLLACYTELAKLDMTTGDTYAQIAKIRRAYLKKAAQCGREEQASKVGICVLCDLRSQGWELRDPRDGPAVRLPADDSGVSAKERVRDAHLLERQSQLNLSSVRRFISEMERFRPWRGGWHSIFCLMREGQELAGLLRETAKIPMGPERESALSRLIDPYVQVVDSDSVCPHTGLRIIDIWRYFRHTWTVAYNSSPGRKVWLLIRDRAAPNHPVIGIAALGSAVVQLKPRDSWIGWTSDGFLKSLVAGPSMKWARWLQNSLKELQRAIYTRDLIEDGLISRADLKRPSDVVIARLRQEGREARRAHELHWKAAGHKRASVAPDTTNWEQQARTYLFRSKRAFHLADLLEVRILLSEAGFTAPSKRSLQKVLGSRAGRRALEIILRQMKASRIGVDILDVTVCGAVDPYRDILGGKLVSLLVASPAVSQAYEARYQSAVSLIASSMAGRPVRRKPRLVLLGTTSLYGQKSSQYNRIKVPADYLGNSSGEPLTYQLLGRSEGFGSYHFSRETRREMDVLLRQSHKGRRINSIFGEGVNPKLRKLRAALDLAGFSSDDLLRHRSLRLVYGIPLAANFREVVLGSQRRVRHIVPQSPPTRGHDLLVKYWIQRWLSRRIENSEVLDKVAANTMTYPIRHGARVELPPILNELPLFSSQGGATAVISVPD